MENMIKKIKTGLKELKKAEERYQNVYNEIFYDEINEIRQVTPTKEEWAELDEVDPANQLKKLGYSGEEICALAIIQYDMEIAQLNRKGWGYTISIGYRSYQEASNLNDDEYKKLSKKLRRHYKKEMK